MRKYIVGFMLCGVLLLSGCSFGSSTDEELAKVMTEMNAAEETSLEAQAELSKLEKSEQTLFNKMMDLTQEEQEELKTKVTEIEELLKQRLDYIDEEEAAVKKAKESVKTLESIVGKVSEEEKAEVEKLRDTVNERYELHSVFVESYKKLTDTQKELYEMLITEETDLAKLEQQVDEVNQQNDAVKSAIVDFNEATASLNELKDKTFSLLKKSNDK